MVIGQHKLPDLFVHSLCFLLTNHDWSDFMEGSLTH